MINDQICPSDTGSMLQYATYMLFFHSLQLFSTNKRTKEESTHCTDILLHNMVKFSRPQAVVFLRQWLNLYLVCEKKKVKANL